MYALALMACLAGLTGCGQKVVVYRPAAANEAYTANAPHAVFDHLSTADADAGSARSPWYARRNDAHLSHRPGGGQASFSAYVIDIYDRQTTSHGDVRNYYHRRTRSIQGGIDLR